MPKATVIIELEKDTRTSSQMEIDQIASMNDSGLVQLAESLGLGFQKLWGNPANVRPREEVLKVLNADPEKTGKLFANHRDIVGFLATKGLMTFEAWELTTPYEATLNAGVWELGEELNQAWKDAAPAPLPQDPEPEPAE